MSKGQLVTLLLVGVVIFSGGYFIGSKTAGKSQPVTPASDQSHAHGFADYTLPRLQRTYGEEFDKAFLLQMIENQQRGVDISQIALKNSSSTEVVTFAEDVIENNSEGVLYLQSIFNSEMTPYVQTGNEAAETTEQSSMGGHEHHH